MAPSIKFTYFNLSGLGEPIRWILKYGNIDFEDERFEYEGAEWPVFKPINDKVHHQRTSITRYCAKLTKLNGKDELEDLEIDAVVNIIGDLFRKVWVALMAQDPAKKEALKASIFSETIPYYLDRLENLAKEKNGHLACKKLTWADINFASGFDTLHLYLDTNCLEMYANLTKVSNNVFNIPQMKKWIEERPKWALRG